MTPLYLFALVVWFVLLPMTIAWAGLLLLVMLRKESPRAQKWLVASSLLLIAMWMLFFMTSVTVLDVIGGATPTS